MIDGDDGRDSFSPRYREAKEDFDELQWEEKRILKYQTKMQNPKILKTVLPGANYALPTYVVTNEGIQDGPGQMICFCKGDKSNEEVYRQEGFFTESLLQVTKEYLQTVNTGDLASRETSMAITKIDEALMWLGKRAEDRILRGVQQTYQK